MLYANNDHRDKMSPSPRLRAKCPDCFGDVSSKCGEINAWHWAHATEACKTGKEPETEWHRNWKLLFPKESCEVKINNFRADVFHKGWAIEFQNSPISVADIKAREDNYGLKMIWVVRGDHFINRFNIYNKQNYHTFKWLHRKRFVETMDRPVFIDFTRRIHEYSHRFIFEIKHTHGKYGWGHVIELESFLDRYRD